MCQQAEQVDAAGFQIGFLMCYGCMLDSVQRGAGKSRLIQGNLKQPGWKITFFREVDNYNIVEFLELHVYFRWWFYNSLIFFRAPA